MIDLGPLAHRLAFEAGDGIMVADSESRVIAANPAIVELLELGDDIIGSDWRRVLLETLGPAERQRLDVDLSTRQEWSGTVMASLPNGGELLVELRVRVSSIALDGAGVGPDVADVDAVVVYATKATNDIALRAALREQARRDGLTGLLNRSGFHGVLREHFEEAQRSGTSVSVLYIDLDNFKSLNDHFGHRYGDLLLTAFANRLRSRLKSSDVVGRLGGDEFVVLFSPELPGPALDSVVSKLKHHLLADYQLDDVTYSCTASFGSAVYPLDATTVEELMDFADHAMYQAKSRGPHEYARFDRREFQSRRDRERLMNAIEAGIERMEFVPYYQPLFDSSTNEIVGAEALVRWIDGDTVRSPAEFLPLVDGGPAGTRLGLRMLDQVVVHARSFAMLDRSVSISVNLSASQLRSEAIVAHIEALAETYPDDVRRLRVELTESAFYDGDQSVGDNLTRILAVGATLSLDDFGTGHSSLLSLRAHEFSQVKIDRQFLAAVSSGDDTDRLLFESMIELCRKLGLETVGEGVETEEELAYVRSQGCDVIQGFLLGRPMTKEDFRALLRAQATRSESRRG